jgi:zinc protease
VKKLVRLAPALAAPMLLAVSVLLPASAFRAAPAAEPVPAPSAASDAQLLEIPVAETPTVALRVVFETGSVDDPSGKLGLCNLTMRAAAEGGTPELTVTQVAELLDPMAASIEVYVGRETTIFSGRVRREDLDAFYPVFWNAIFHPRFETADIERLREATLSSLVHDLKANDDERLGKEALQSLIFGGTAWEHPGIGGESGLRAITPDDVRTFHRTMVVRPLVHVGIAGSYDPAFATRVREDLARLPEGPVPARSRTIEPPRPSGVEVELIDKPARSTAISIGFAHTVKRGDPDYWPLFVASIAFGEHRTFHGRLQREMRSTRGLNYGNYAYLDHYEQEGWGRFSRTNAWRAAPYFSIWIRPVQPENGPFALRQGIWELRHLIDAGLTEQEFETSREHVRNVSQLWKQTLQRRLGLAMDDAHFGRGDVVAELQSALDSMTVDQVNAALESRLAGENLWAVLVCANAASLRDLLRSGKPTPITYSGGGAPDAVRAKDAEIERMDLGLGRVRVIEAEAIYR